MELELNKNELNEKMKLTNTEKDKIVLKTAQLVSNILKNKNNTEKLEDLVMNKCDTLFKQIESDDLKILTFNRVKRDGKQIIVDNVKMFEDFDAVFKVDSIRSDEYRDLLNFIYRNKLTSTYQRIAREMIHLEAIKKYI
ncbi:hypothetical protein KW496_19685 [Vibrio fluvialis]|nr:hypothetical protein [Vibrio fluvialis]